MKIGRTGLEQDIPRPTSFSIDPVEVSKSERTASGRLVKDIVAIKNEYNLTYQGLKPNQLKIFTDLYALGDPVSFIYDDASGEQTKSVYITSLPRGVFVRRPSLSENVTITLVEE